MRGRVVRFSICLAMFGVWTMRWTKMPGVWMAAGSISPGLHQMLDLRHGDFAGGCHHRIEVAGRLAINEIAFGIALIGVDDRDIGDKAALHDIGGAVEFAQLLSLRHEGPNAGFCEKCRNPGAPCPDAFGECALRIEFEFQFAGQILPLEELVLADIRRDHLFDLPRLEQNAQSGAIDPRIVRDDRQILDPEIMNGLDQNVRNAAKPKSSRHEDHSVLDDVGQGRTCIWINFVHARSSLAGITWPLASRLAALAQWYGGWAAQL